MDIVNEILSKAEIQKQQAENDIRVEKLIPLETYIQDLLVADTNEINTYQYKDNKEEHVQGLARDCVQHLLNELSQRATEVKDGKTFIQVSNSAFGLPREKPVPTPKPLTKWQKFARDKGLKKTKKPKSTWDDVLQKWVPNYGYRKAAAERQKNWLIEVPQNVHPQTDMFAERSKTRKENIAKNEYQRLRNIAAARKLKVPKFGLPPLEANLHSNQLKTAAEVARVSTASVGKFQPKLPNEKNENTATKKAGNKKKRKLMDFKEEKEKNLRIVEMIAKKKPKLDVEKAVNNHMQEEQTEMRDEKSKTNSKRKGGKKKKGKERSSAKKPKSRKGERAAGGKKKSGRKRR